MRYDVIIIGAGSMGMAAGYYLAKEGKKVALVDSNDPPHIKGSHHGETRLIRHGYGEGEKYVPLALRSQELWYELENESNRKLFHKTGVLNIGTKESTFLKNVIQSAKRYDLNAEVLNAVDINRRWEGYHLNEDLLACYEPNAGVLMSEEAIQAYRELAIQYGADLFLNENVERIDIQSDHVTIGLKDKRLHGNQLIITAGKGTNKITALFEQELPLTPIRKTFSWFQAAEEKYKIGSFPAWSFDNGQAVFYGFPSMNKSGPKIGRHDGGIPLTKGEELASFGSYTEDEEDVTEFAKQTMSETLIHKLGKVCTYTNSPDGDFIIDRFKEYPHVMIACGFSGHGFKFSSAIGEVLSQMAIKGNSTQDISFFSLDRFKQGSF
ncbi:N-methyl-L-tryptophan oxidase [Oceanobacillus longus]|uniref:N-methyl-L-tryptophan oxidase n=1 Tax=Oceanobacillus longus TaxID=930120 RepID=A0ABV8GVC7_9BACI